MTQEEKELLLKDLCARLLYGIKVWYKYYPTNITEEFATSIRLADNKIALSSKLNREGDWYPIEEANEILIKPYLRPMSSMTEEEFLEYHYIKYNKLTYRHKYKRIDVGKFHNVGVIPIGDYLDWLNTHHFDYRGLIEKGLALVAPEGMYNIKNK